MEIRRATLQDLEAIAQVEAQCFPAAEAADHEAFRQRLTYYPHHFWLLWEDGQLVSFVDGFVSDEKDLLDVMYEDASLHTEDGRWQMIFGVNTIPAYRKKGYAGKLLQCMIADAKEQGREGLVLTCKDALVPYYASFGFVDEGISEKSVHGGVVWHQMRLVLKKESV